MVEIEEVEEEQRAPATIDKEKSGSQSKPDSTSSKFHFKFPASKSGVSHTEYQGKALSSEQKPNAANSESTENGGYPPASEEAKVDVPHETNRDESTPSFASVPSKILKDVKEDRDGSKGSDSLGISEEQTEQNGADYPLGGSEDKDGYETASEGDAEDPDSVNKSTIVTEEKQHDGIDALGEGKAGQTPNESKNQNSNSVTPAEDVFEDALTEEEQRKRNIAQAEIIKAEGNAAYTRGEFDAALKKYAQALDIAPNHDDAKELRASCHSNSAICHIRMEKWEEAVRASTLALELHPSYVKALLRRAQALEHVDKQEDALADLNKVLELEPNDKQAAASARRLEPIVTEKREKMKEEMLGKLKDLGNSVLGHFGMSLDNFKAVKDPATGSYSINFNR